MIAAATWEDFDDGTAERSARRRARLALPAVLLAIAFVMPPETSVSLGSLRLSPYRVILLLAVVPSIMHLLSGKAGKLNAVDIFVFLHSIWCVIALGAQGGLGFAVETGGIYFVEAMGAYAMGRRYVRNPDDFHALCLLLALLVCGQLAFALPESLTHQHFLRETFRAVLGGPALPHIDPRLGLSRAFGSFEHPILFGVFCTMAFATAYYVVRPRLGGARAWLIIAAIALASFVSLSAGAWLMLAIQVALVGWDRVTAGLPGRWAILGLMFAGVLVVVSLLSNRSPVKVFISYASFSAQSSYNRILIWDYGTAEVARHPLLGIGLGDWIRAPWMSASMDNFWLVVAVRYGLPALLFLVAAIVTIIAASARQRGNSREWIDCRAGWIVTVAAIAIASCTVHLWNNTFGFFMFFIGAGAWLVERPASETRSPSHWDDEASLEGRHHESW
jgi:hypothetical protein